MKIFKKIFTDDPLQQRLQDSVAASFSQFEKLPQLDSVIIEDVALTVAVDNQVQHSLQRRVVGWQIIRINAGAIVYESPTINTLPSSTIILRTTANCTVSILFF